MKGRPRGSDGQLGNPKSHRGAPEQARRDSPERPGGRQSYPRGPQEEEKGAEETPKALSIPFSAAMYAKCKFPNRKTKVFEARTVHFEVKHRDEEASRKLWRSMAHGEASRRTARRRQRGPEANEGLQKKPEETPKSGVKAAKATQEAPHRR